MGVVVDSDAGEEVDGKRHWDERTETRGMCGDLVVMGGFVGEIVGLQVLLCGHCCVGLQVVHEYHVRRLAKNLTNQKEIVFATEIRIVEI